MRLSESYDPQCALRMAVRSKFDLKALARVFTIPFSSIDCCRPMHYLRLSLDRPDDGQTAITPLLHYQWRASR